jgi:soluble lytic murein transglycosylase-like protein
MPSRGQQLIQTVRQRPLVVGAIGVGLLTLIVALVTGRRRILAFGRQVFTVAHRAAFRATLPPAGQRYADDILAVAQAEGVSPFLIAAIMDRESRYGQALRPPGPAGTGDNGHGHGLMQIDDRSHAAFIATGGWKIPRQAITYATRNVIKPALNYFKARPGAGATVRVPSSSYAARQGVPPGTYPDPRPLEGTLLVRATVAAYNTGPLNVLRAVAARRDPDTTSTGSDYGQDVLARAQRLATAFDQEIV